MTPAKDQHTVVEFVDYAAVCHKVQEVRVNGFPVRVEPDSITIGVSNGRNSTATTVTLTLQVDEIHFSHEKAEPEGSTGRSVGPHVHIGGFDEGSFGGPIRTGPPLAGQFARAVDETVARRKMRDGGYLDA